MPISEKIFKSLSQLTELYSPDVNERVITLGKIDTAGYYLVYYDKANPVHAHPDFSGNFLIIQGKGKILLGKENYINFFPGDVFRVTRNTVHQVVPEQPTLLLAILDPAPVFDEEGWKNSSYAQ